MLCKVKLLQYIMLASNHKRLYRSESCDALFGNESDNTSSLKLAVYRAEYVDDGDDHDDWDPSLPASRNGANIGCEEEAARSE